MEQRHIEIGYCPEMFGDRAWAHGAFAYAAVSAGGAQWDVHIPAGGLSKRQALWTALKAAIKAVGGASGPLTIATSHGDIPLVREMARLMLGESARSVSVEPIPGTEHDHVRVIELSA
jgi:hypothetical protein